MTEALQIRHLLAHLRSFAFLIHGKPVKLTTMHAKDTKNLLSGGAPCGLSQNRNLADVVRPL
jgi:hypothetical protein